MPRSNKKTSAGSLLVLGLLWTAFSTIFLILGVKSFYNGVNRASWPQTPCQISQFEINADPNKNPPFQPEVRYQYDWRGTNHTGSKVWATQKGEDDYENLGELIEQHRLGQLTHCYVNPKSPSKSTLLASGKDFWGKSIFAIFGSVFVAIGIGMIIGSRIQKKIENRPISSSGTHKGRRDDSPKAIMIPFFAVFALAGFGILFFLIIPQWTNYTDSQSWVEAPAEVIWSRVQSHRSDDSTTYSVDIFYSYQFDDITYKSNSTDLFSSSSSDRASKQEVVNAHPAGKKITCFINPEQPWQALLGREIGWRALFALFPLPFIAVGIWGLWSTLRKRSTFRKKNFHSDGTDALGRQSSSFLHSSESTDVYHRETHSQLRDYSSSQSSSAHQSRQFSPGGNRIKTLIATLFFALIWNGIISIFVNIAVKSWLADNPEWFLSIFIIPFVAIGLGAIGYFIYSFLGLFNPTPKLMLTPGSITLGENTQLTWKIPRRSHRLTQFSIYLLGEENAEYRRGTNTVTSQQIFHEQVLLETTSARKASRGNASFSLPLETMPTWSSAHNSIKWSIAVRGDISFWPDINDIYEIDVLAPDLNSTH